jgi:choline dehydrogenase-like flavoprotein
VTRIVVVGGGVSGAHAALTLLERGEQVELWDVGREEASFSEPGATFHDLKQRLADPLTFFLGTDLQGLVPPTSPELLRYPPARQFLATVDDRLWSFASDGFVAQGSFTKGGLANGWGANALAFDENDLSGWPVSCSEMDACYKIACQRIPVSGPIEDDLSPYLGGVHPSQPAVRLTLADARLLRAYARRKRVLAKLGVCIGVARLAVITDPARRDACDACDRCLWGCPRASIYNPRVSTLAACEAYGRFRYVPGRLVLSLVGEAREITRIRYLDLASDRILEEPCGVVFLAAGALQTGAIFLRTLNAARPELGARTDGLMDTTVVRIPFVQWRAIGDPPVERSFQFNRLIAGMITQAPPWPRYLHGELLNLTSLVYHPLIGKLPFDTRLSKQLFFALRSAIGTATFFFPDRITPENHQLLGEPSERQSKVVLRYRESSDKERFIRQSLGQARLALRKLGCLPRVAVRSPPGAGIHYAGTVPMGAGPKRCEPSGRSNLFSNLYIADGAAFPSLPSKSITMSLAAHATRVARGAQL